MLTAGGYEVVCVTDAEEALLVLPDALPDLVLMDLNLPGIDGLEATLILREDPRTASIPIVVLSALAFAADRERALKAGCADYLTKPVGARQLLDRVDGILGVARARV